MLEAGRVLTTQEKAIFKPYFAYIVLEQARVVEGKVPFWLRHTMCAVVLYNKIYIRAGHYRRDTKSGIELLGHELMHVSQFLHGMTLLKYAWSCRYGYRKSRYEVEAYAKAKLIVNTFE